VDYVYMMSPARIVAHGTPAQLRGSGEAFVKQFVRGETDGPIPFHFPAPPYEADLAAVAHG
jgi:phospholipid/cholesterol/gamma-HCH transport system ATP-binding protein